MGFENGRLVKVIVRATDGVDQQVATFHYDLIDDVAEPANNPQQLADDFRDDVIPGWLILFTPAWSFDPVEVVEELDPLNPTDPRESWVSGSSTPGTNDGGNQLLPRGICGLVSLKTAHIGRRFRGRWFLMGQFDEVGQNGGVWSGGVIGVMDDLIASIPREPDLADGVSTSTARWCIYSRTQRAANADPYASAVTDAIRRDQLHYLRSRAQY